MKVAMNDSRGRSKEGRPTSFVLLAGGGSGAKTLKQSVLNSEQQKMFKRTLELTPLQRKKNDQEIRQTQIWERKGSVTVNVSREDFPAMSADIELHFIFKDAQLAWKVFLQKVKAALQIEYIDRIIDRADSSVVLRILSLFPGGKYFARQTETSCILDLVSTGKKPYISTSKSLDEIKEAQLEMRASERYQIFIDDKTKSLLSRSMTYVQEFSASAKILKATSAREIIELVEYFYNVKNAPDGEGAAIEPPGNDAWLSTSVMDAKDNIDLISLYRLALESLNRMVFQSPEKRDEVAKDALLFVLDAIRMYRQEIDAMLLAMRLLTEIASELSYLDVSGNKMVLWELMETIQYYGPSAPAYRVRQIPLRITLAEEAEEARRLAAETAAKTAAEADAAVVTADEAAVQAREVIALPSSAAAAQLGDNYDDRMAAEEDADVVAPLDSTFDDVSNSHMDGRQTESFIVPQALLTSVPSTARSTAQGPAGAGAGVVKKTRAWKGSVGVGNVGKKKEIMVEEVAEVVAVKVLTRDEKFASLPKVPGSKFSGLARLGPKSFKRNMALTQCFATLFKFVNCSYAVRAVALDQGIHLEVAEMAFYCEAQPGLLSYIFWIIDSLWSDTFGEGGRVADLYASLSPFDDDYETFHLPSSFLHKWGNLAEVDLMRYYLATETVAGSEQSEVVSVDQADAAVVPEQPIRREKRKVVYAVDLDSGKRLVVNRDVMNAVGYFKFRDRYLVVPPSDVVVAIALASRHADVNEKDRGVASMWLEHWDDGTPHFTYLVKRGGERSGCTFDFAANGE